MVRKPSQAAAAAINPADLPRVSESLSVAALKEEYKFRGHPVKGMSTLKKADLLGQLVSDSVLVTGTPEYKAVMRIKSLMEGELDGKRAAAAARECAARIQKEEEERNLLKQLRASELDSLHTVAKRAVHKCKMARTQDLVTDIAGGLPRTSVAVCNVKEVVCEARPCLLSCAKCNFDVCYACVEFLELAPWNRKKREEEVRKRNLCATGSMTEIKVEKKQGLQRGKECEELSWKKGKSTLKREVDGIKREPAKTEKMHGKKEGVKEKQNMTNLKRKREENKKLESKRIKCLADAERRRREEDREMEELEDQEARESEAIEAMSRARKICGMWNDVQPDVTNNFSSLGNENMDQTAVLRARCNIAEGRVEEGMRGELEWEREREREREWERQRQKIIADVESEEQIQKIIADVEREERQEHKGGKLKERKRRMEEEHDDVEILGYVGDASKTVSKLERVNKDEHNALSFVVRHWSWYPPDRFHSYLGPAESIFDSSFSTKLEANKRAKYLFYDENQWGVGADEIESMDVKTDKVNGLVSFTCTGGDSQNWAVDVVPKAVYEVRRKKNKSPGALGLNSVGGMEFSETNWEAQEKEQMEMVKFVEGAPKTVSEPPPASRNKDSVLAFIVRHSEGYEPDGWHSYMGPAEKRFDTSFASKEQANKRAMYLFYKKNTWGLGVDEMMENDIETSYAGGMVHLTCSPPDSGFWTVDVVPKDMCKRFANGKEQWYDDEPGEEDEEGEGNVSHVGPGHHGLWY